MIGHLIYFSRAVSGFLLKNSLCAWNAGPWIPF